MRPVNLHVTSRAVVVLSVQIMLRTGRLNGSNVMRDAVAGQTKLVDGAVLQQSRIRRAVRNVTSRASFGLDWSMFKNERPLFVGVTLYAGGINAGGQSGLFQLKPAVWIVAVATLQRAFEHFVMEGCVELMFDFRVAA